MTDNSQDRGQPAIVNAVSLTDICLGVVAGVVSGDDTLSTTKPHVYGTAFAIADGLFITAAHVLRDARRDCEMDGGTIALAHRDKGSGLKWAAVRESEAHFDLDLAILLCPDFSPAPVIPINVAPLGILTPVASVGYPQAVETTTLMLVHRAFSGHVSTRRELTHLDAHPAGYELTFQAPPGLSGAPLFIGNPTRSLTLIAGWIIENWHYHNQLYSCALAVSADALLSVHSKIVGGPLASIWDTDPVPLPPPTPVRNPNIVQYDTSLEGWPEEEEGR